MGRPRTYACIAALIAATLTLAACQGTTPTQSPSASTIPATTSATPTPTPSATTPTPSKTPSASAALSPEAEQVVKQFFETRETFLRTGKTSPEMGDLVTGEAVNQMADFVTGVVTNTRRYEGGSLALAWITSAPEARTAKDQEVALTCLDTTGVTIFENGRNTGKGRFEQERFHIQRVEKQLKIGLIESAEVASCAK